MPAPNKITIYDPQGRPRDCFPVDAREILAHGHYTVKPPIHTAGADVVGAAIDNVSASATSLAITDPEPVVDIPPLPLDPSPPTPEEIARTVRVAVTGDTAPDFKLCESYSRRDLATYAEQWGVTLDQRMKPDNMLADFKAKMKRRDG